MTAALRSISSAVARAAPRSAASVAPRLLLLRAPARRPSTAHHAAQVPQAHVARAFHASPAAMHGGKGRPMPGEGVTLHFKRANGEVTTVEANVGDDIVDVSWEYDLDIEAACEKSVACSTCHVILEEDVYDKLEEPDDDENDMLDLAFGLTDTSRLGCQVKVTKDMDGTTITLPSATRNLRVD
ncbi:hypothetical protein JCM3770_007141, partial [Rhodotorula araucariae]